MDAHLKNLLEDTALSLAEILSMFDSLWLEKELGVSAEVLGLFKLLCHAEAFTFDPAWQDDEALQAKRTPPGRPKTCPRWDSIESIKTYGVERYVEGLLVGRRKALQDVGDVLLDRVVGVSDDYRKQLLEKELARARGAWSLTPRLHPQP